MDEVKQYKTAGAFRTALETRLQTRAQEERTDLQRLRRQVAFDRFLARLFPKESTGTYERYAASLIFLSDHIHQNELLPRLHAGGEGDKSATKIQQMGICLFPK